MPEMDVVCRDIRELLGESLPDISRSALPLEQVTTPVLQALELHSRSIRLQRLGEYQEAAYLEAEAIHEDSLFAMAVSELSYIHRKLGNDSLSLYYHRRSRALIDRATERERLYMSAIYYGPSFELDLPKAYEYAHQLVVRYPNDAEGFSLLGWLAMYDGNTGAAIDAFRRSLALDSVTYAASVFNNWGYALAIGGDGARAREFYYRSSSLRPKYSAIDGYIAQSHWITEAPDSAARTLREALPHADGQEKLSRYMELASLCEFSGALARARDVCREAIDEARKMKRPGDEAYFHYLLGELAAELSDPDAYASEMKESANLSRSPFFELPLIGSSYARRGRFGDCERILSLIGSAKSDDPFFVKRRSEYISLVKGEGLLNRKSFDSASREFRSIQRLYGGDPVYLLAQWGAARCADSRHDSTAVNLYEKLLGMRGEVVMACIRNTRTSGFWIRQLWTDVDFALGKWYLARGDSDRAREHIRRSLTFTNDADTRDQRARDAKKILSQLTGAHQDSHSIHHYQKGVHP
jgi:tetratricopeptide (TPR) repeat protein